MKKIVLTISVILSFFGLLITASPYILQISGLDEPLKQFIIPRLIDVSRGSIDVEKFRIGLGQLELSDVTVSLASEQYQMHLNAIEFKINFLDLLTHPTSPQKAVYAIHVIEPLVVLGDKTHVQSDSAAAKPLRLHELINSLNQITSINEIKIDNGRLQLKTNADKINTLADHLNGKLICDDSLHIRLSGDGSFFTSATEDFRFEAQIDLENERMNARLFVNNFRIDSQYLAAFTDKVQIESGTVSGALSFENHGFFLDSTLISGDLQAVNINAAGHALRISDVKAKLSLADNRCTQAEISGFYFDEPFYIEATVENILKPVVNASFQLKQVRLDRMASDLSNNFLHTMFFDIKGNALFDVQQGDFEANMAADSIKIGKNILLHALETKLSWKDDRLAIDYLAGNWHGVALTGDGSYQSSAAECALHLGASWQSGKHVFLDRLSGASNILDLKLNYSGHSQNIQGGWAYAAMNATDTVLAAGGLVSGNKQRVNIRLDYSTAPDWQGSIQIENLESQFKVSQARLINFPAALLINDPVIKDLVKKYSSDINLSGTLESFNGNISVFNRQNLRTAFRLTTSIQNIFSGQEQIKGGLQLINLDGLYSISLGKQTLNAQFRFPAGIDGVISFNNLEDSKLSGYVHFQNFNVMQALSDSASRDDFRLLGAVNGHIDIGGSLQNPEIHGLLTGDKFVFNDVGYYQTELKFSAGSRLFSIDSLSVSLNNWPVLQGRGNMDFSNRTLTGSFAANNVDAEQILSTLNPGKRVLTGVASYAIELDGSIDNPEISADVEIKKGSLDVISFDELKFFIRDQFRSGGHFFSLSDHALIIEEFRVSKKDLYSFKAEGQAPLNAQDEVNLNLEFSGDAFSFIPYWEPFFRAGRCQGEIKAQIVGNYDQLRLAQGSVKIENGELYLRQVATHIKNIHGLIELTPGTNQINFIDFQTDVNNRTLTLNTVRHVQTADRGELKHWYFKGLDLDFGVLKMETSEGGVEVSIPGLMNEVESGRLNLTGRKAGEFFYFAGPVKHPVARGTVTLYNARLTYPFLGGDKPANKRSSVIQFLMDIEWNLMVRSGEDVKYFREIPAYIDNVNTEVFVDESSPGLELNGILQNGSFGAKGRLSSSRGRLEYLDQAFKVDYFSIEFNESDRYPVISGRAWTTIRDSVGAIPKTIYLQLYAIDEESGAEKQQGNWENFKFKLVSADPQIGESQEQVLAYLGFSVGNIKDKATSVGGAMTEKYLFRPLLRPIERALEKNLGVDLVRINSNIARNLFYGSLGSSDRYSQGRLLVNPFNTSTPYLFLMQSSEVTVGKYLTQDIYLTYTGQLVSLYDKSQTSIDFNHSFGIEYRFLRNVLVELEYDRELLGYYKIPNQKQYLEDFKIRLRHSFTF